MIIILISAIKKGDVSPSLLDKVINKDKYIDTEKSNPLLTRLQKPEHTKPMYMDDILTRLGSSDGEDELISEVGKGEPAFSNTVNFVSGF